MPGSQLGHQNASKTCTLSQKVCRKRVPLSRKSTSRPFIIWDTNMRQKRVPLAKKLSKTCTLPQKVGRSRRMSRRVKNTYPRVLHQLCRRPSKPSPNEPIPKWSPTRIELILVGNALIRALFQPILRGAHADWPAGWLGGRLAGWMAGWLAAGTPFYV